MVRSPETKLNTTDRKRRSFSDPLSLLACVIFLASAHLWVIEWERHRDLQVLRWDMAGYHHYLPATLIYNDIRDLSYLGEHIPVAARTQDEVEWFGIIPSATGHVYIKYSCGVALMDLPGFLIAHAWTLWIDKNHPPDGYSEPYQHAVEISSFLYAFFGLLLLRKFLLRYVGDLHAAIAIVAIGTGTNLFFYSTLNAGMSHAYLFFLVAAVIELTARWHERPAMKKAILLGLALGMILVTRPIDILIILVPILWGIRSITSAKAKLHQLIVHKHHVLVLLLCMIPPLIPQMLYWKATTGSYIFYSYTGEGFDLQLRNIWNGLFSYRKGWFIYTPLAFIGVLALIIMLLKEHTRRIILPFALYLPVIVIAVFSWSEWWYGGGFGARPLIESLPVLALPLAWASQQIHRRSFWLWLPFCIVIALGVRLNMFQQHQYHIGMLHYEHMNKERYWEIFLKDDDDWGSLRKFPYEEE